MLALVHLFLLSNLCVTTKLLIYPQDLIWQMAVLRSLLLFNTASYRI